MAARSVDAFTRLEPSLSELGNGWAEDRRAASRIDVQAVRLKIGGPVELVDAAQVVGVKDGHSIVSRNGLDRGYYPGRYRG